MIKEKRTYTNAKKAKLARNKDKNNKRMIKEIEIENEKKRKELRGKMFPINGKEN